jgi:hypothetical protein
VPGQSEGLCMRLTAAVFLYPRGGLLKPPSLITPRRTPGTH